VLLSDMPPSLAGLVDLNDLDRSKQVEDIPSGPAC
jgi:hypothetical protein